MKKKRSDNFSKFAQKKSNAAVKEQFKQEKRKVKKEREEYFDEKRKQRSVAGGQTPAAGNRSYGKFGQKTENAQPSHLRLQTSDVRPRQLKSEV